MADADTQASFQDWAARVIIAGITGDVVDITLTHVILNQVGGTVAGNGRDAVYLFQMPSCSVKQSQIIRLM